MVVVVPTVVIVAVAVVVTVASAAVVSVASAMVAAVLERLRLRLRDLCLPLDLRLRRGCPQRLCKLLKMIKSGDRICFNYI
jgi:hypothetical protein